MKPLYIFDLDGTLALTEHRQHIVDDVNNPDRWREFFAACVNDSPNEPVIRTLQTLADAGCEIRIWSGRSDEVAQQTVDWLDYWGCRARSELKMRAAGDYTPDDKLKLSWLRALPEADRERLVAIFDDRDKVVAMWRDEGVACFQVARGEF